MHGNKKSWARQHLRHVLEDLGAYVSLYIQPYVMHFVQQLFSNVITKVMKQCPQCCVYLRHEHRVHLHFLIALTQPNNIITLAKHSELPRWLLCLQLPCLFPKCAVFVYVIGPLVFQTAQKVVKTYNPIRIYGGIGNWMYQRL